MDDSNQPAGLEPEPEPEPEPDHRQRRSESTELEPEPDSSGPARAPELAPAPERAGGSSFRDRNRVAVRDLSAAANQLQDDVAHVQSDMEARHALSDSRYASKVAEKRRARNQTEGDFSRAAKVKVMHVRAVERAAASGTEGGREAESMIETMRQETEEQKRQMEDHHWKAKTRNASRVAAKRAKRGLTMADFGRVTEKGKQEKAHASSSSSCCCCGGGGGGGGCWHGCCACSRRCVAWLRPSCCTRGIEWVQGVWKQDCNTRVQRIGSWLRAEPPQFRQLPKRKGLLGVPRRRYDEMLQEIKRNRIEMVVVVGYVVLNLVSLFVVLGQGTSRTLLLSLATTLGFLVLWFWKSLAQCCFSGLRSVEHYDSFWWFCYFVWSYISLITVCPLILMAPSNEEMAATHGADLIEQPFYGAIGVFGYGGGLWLTGWGCLWYKKHTIFRLTPSDRDRSHMPSGAFPLLSLCYVIVESWNYSAFSFFPALPWRALDLPSYWPSALHPQTVMLFSLGETDDFSQRHRQFDNGRGVWHSMTSLNAEEDEAAAAAAATATATATATTADGDDQDGYSYMTVRHGIFLCSSATICLGFLAVFWSRRYPLVHSGVTELFFVLLAFPLIKQLCGIFGCTSVDVWIPLPVDHADSNSNSSGLADARPFCMLQQGMGTSYDQYDQYGVLYRIVPGAQCMDNDPTRQCYDDEFHLWYVAAVVILLTPYYLGALWYLIKLLVRQSVIAQDATWAFVSLQSKVLLSVIASVYGDCHPKTMLTSVGFVIFAQLVLLRRYDRGGWHYSGVLALNCAHSTGLYLAAINWGFAVIVFYNYKDHPEASTRCVRHPLTPESIVNGTNVTTTAARASAGEGKSGEEYFYEYTTTYTYAEMAIADGYSVSDDNATAGGSSDDELPILMVWLLVNVGFSLCGYLRYRWMVSFSTWETDTWHPPLSYYGAGRSQNLNSSLEAADEVDYALVAARVRAAQSVAKAKAADAAAAAAADAKGVKEEDKKADSDFALEIRLIEPGFGSQQQLEKTTLNMALLAADPGVSISIRGSRDDSGGRRRLRAETLERSWRMQQETEELVNTHAGHMLVDKLLAMHDTAEVSERLSRPWGVLMCCGTGMRRCCECKHAGCLQGTHIAKAGCRFVSCCWCRCRRNNRGDPGDSDIDIDSDIDSGSAPVFISDVFPFIHNGDRLPVSRMASLDVSGFQVHGNAITGILSRHIAIRSVNLSHCGIGYGPHRREDILRIATALEGTGTGTGTQASRGAAYSSTSSSSRVPPVAASAAWEVTAGPASAPAGIGSTALLPAATPVTVPPVVRGPAPIIGFDTLDFSGNPLGDGGIVSLISALESSSTTVANLNIAGCGQSSEGISAIEDMLRANTPTSRALERLTTDTALRKYYIEVITGDTIMAGTAANVSITLFGTGGTGPAVGVERDQDGDWESQ